MKKRLGLRIGGLLLVLLSVAGATYAILINRVESQGNVLSAGSIALQLKIPDTGCTDWGDACPGVQWDGLYPGWSDSYEVYLSNTSTTPLELSVLPTLTKAEGSSPLLWEAVMLALSYPDGSNATETLPLSDWETNTLETLAPTITNGQEQVWKLQFSVPATVGDEIAGQTITFNVRFTGTETTAPADPDDADSDGYDAIGSGGTDCDDTNPSVNPGAAEACNGTDDNCDSVVDEGVCSAGLFFSEYIEGSSYNKAVEVYNPLSSPVNLEGYSIEVYANGGVAPTYTVDLPAGELASQDVYVLCHTSANSLIQGVCDLPTGSMNFSGDDAVVLKNPSGVILDSIGQVGFDPGTEWGSGMTSTADNSLVRKSTVLMGDTTVGDTFDPAVSWDGYATDTFSYLGSR